MGQFEWHSPLAFILLALLAVAFLYLFFNKKKGTFFYSDLNLFANSPISLRAQLIFIPNFLIALSLLALIFALARPQSAEQASHQSQEGLDIMIAMDISLSMMIEDMGPSITRLSASKEVVKKFIEGRPYDRIGLIVFAGESFTKTPLTYDHDLLKKNLLGIKSYSTVEGGTAIGVALANATARLQYSPKKSRVLIFLTDGENNAGFIDPETALGLVKQNEIKVYTIGLGKKSGQFFVTIEDKDLLGRKVYRKVRIKSRINEELMKKISQQTGGEFFMANNLYSLQNIFNKVSELETYEIKIDKWTKYTEYFENILLIGFILYLLSVFLSITVFFRGL
ncbi:MAG: VWA domain-containing protein [Bdellovibrionaceae bacterium]|nr:VWA domain-containing protein [Pseudobdellovibrionaceae bacterium]